jgi:hypothetical protein
VSYDFLMFKATVPVNSQDDLSEKTVELQSPDAVKGALAALFPSLSWRESFGNWWARAEDEDGHYEFQVGVEPSQAWSIHTSHRRSRRDAIANICKALGLVAFDGQAMTLIDERGERPA